MRRKFFGLVMLACAWVLGAQAAFAAPACPAIPAGGLTIGVNRPHLGWEADPNPILDEIAAHFSAVRLTGRGDIDKVAATIIHAKQDCMRVLVTIPLGASEFYNVPPMPGKGGADGARYRLSQLNLDLVRKNVAHLVSDLDAAHVSLDTAEVGNEINWSGFNADFPISGTGQSYDDAAAADRDHPGILEGLKRYAAAAKIVKEVMRASAYQKHAAVIGAGLMTGLAEFVERSGGTSLSPRAVYAALKQVGGTDELDGFAIHIYPNIGKQNASPEAAINGVLSDMLDECAPDGRDCYITEWGFVLPANACPSEDPRNEEFRSFLHAVRAQQTAYHVKAAYVYDWDTSKSRSLYRCGRMLPDPTVFR